MMEETKTISRSEFLIALGKGAVFVTMAAGGYATWTRATGNIARPKVTTPTGTPHSPWYSMSIDIEKCIGCGLCVQACSKENNVPAGNFRTWIERYVVKEDGTVQITSPDGGINGFENDVPDEGIEKAFFVPKLCNHCTDSPCTQVCPVGATFITEDGVVLVDYDYCIGCGYCIQACPYGSRFFNRERKTADKCTLCYHRIKKGKLPACVEVCPVEARIFGDLSDEESPISKFNREHAVMALKPEMKTGAKVFYNGMTKEVV
ncbi:MAG: 4Fe-4S dicluster domain-containing protein [Fimbriimonadaceae bacterium]|nr:4Fe-4S dicluster domain-containing protein [Chthonomonadaceae bacterium]MCO5295757.1 4Fe-4S dicluster domain-containing protein [Fimbriimonadaceae bacterium]